MRACGLDFGTSNSVIGVIADKQPVLAQVENGETLIPSAIFFDFEEHQTRFGLDGIALPPAPIFSRSPWASPCGPIAAPATSRNLSAHPVFAACQA